MAPSAKRNPLPSVVDMANIAPTELADLGRASLEDFITAMAEEMGFTRRAIPEGFRESLLQTLKGADLPSVKDLALEKALRWAARGEFETAGRILLEAKVHASYTDAAFDEALTGRRRQQAHAKKPRPDRLQVLIEQIVKKAPHAGTAEVRRELAERAGHGVVEEIDEEENAIFFIGDGRSEKSASLSGLKDRVSRARRSLPRAKPRSRGRKAR